VEPSEGEADVWAQLPALNWLDDSANDTSPQPTTTKAVDVAPLKSWTLEAPPGEQRPVPTGDGPPRAPDEDYVAYVRATEQNPSDVGAWIGRAVTALDAFDAVKSWAHALALDPRNEDVERELDMVLTRKVAVASMHQVNEFIDMADTLAQQGLRARAAQVYSRVTELDLECEAAWLGWARVTNDPLERLTFLQRALQVEPANAATRQELLTAKRQLREEAERLLEQGTRAANSDQLSEAHILFKRAVELEPEDDRAWLGCARTSENLVDKLGYLKQALKLNPQNEEARDLYSILSSFVGGEGHERWSLTIDNSKMLLLGAASIGLFGVLMALVLLPRLLG
jgi:tetratricopeptide (TPR) repeat protein